jgi:DNA-binding transcriptional MerR regulator
VTPGLTVGDFSRITHLSVKTLRHYHQVGLLEPATVNPDTGYRYYGTDQVPTAQVIRRLRDLEMPVAEVKAVLTAPDAPARNTLIAAHLDRLEAELAQTRAAVDSLRNLLRPADAPAIEHRSVPATPAAGIFQADRGEATVFGPVEGSVRAIGRVAPLLVPAAELAIIIHPGPMEDADLSYAKLGSYATTHEISIDGPLREYYVRGGSDTPDQADWRTEIGWPIFRADGSS